MTKAFCIAPLAAASPTRDAGRRLRLQTLQRLVEKLSSRRSIFVRDTSSEKYHDESLLHLKPLCYPFNNQLLLFILGLALYPRKPPT